MYPGVPKDYTGKVMFFFVKHETDVFILYLNTILTVLQDVTPENFLAALKGDSYAMKKTNPKVIARFVSLVDYSSDTNKDNDRI